MKTLHIQAKEWFDKVNGNSYFSARVTIDNTLPTEKTIYVPFQYGYGSQFEQAAFHQLQLDNILPEGTIYAPSRYCRENGIIYTSKKQENCLQRDGH